MPSSSPERSLVTGANGQDGGYLVERLLAAGDEVHGACRNEDETDQFSTRYPNANSHVADLADADAIRDLIRAVRPTRVFNLAGISSVAQSWESPVETADVVGLGPVRILESLRELSTPSGRGVRFIQASSAEVFGDALTAPQSELTQRSPVSPYGVAKNFADQLANTFRARGMFVGIAILFNHESARRPESFVSAKIAASVARIAEGMQHTLKLGNLDVERDWGFAPDYVDALIRISEQPTGEDFVVATGESHSVREFVAAAFAAAGIANWEQHVIVDDDLVRPSDPRRMVGDARKLRALGWAPTVTFVELAARMVNAERDRIASAIDA